MFVYWCCRKPRVDTDDSHLRFVTPRNKDIEFSPGAGGHVILGGVYLDERALMPVKGDKVKKFIIF